MRALAPETHRKGRRKAHMLETLNAFVQFF
jgi:hypothetical protein